MGREMGRNRFPDRHRPGRHRPVPGEGAHDREDKLMRTAQRVSEFVASQVNRRDFLRRASTMALGVAVAMPSLGQHQKNRATLDLTPLQRIPFGTPQVLSASEVVALGLPLYLPNNQLPSGPDCPCDCSWGCQWVTVGYCNTRCGDSCEMCNSSATGEQTHCTWQQCLDCCNDICSEQCVNCACQPCYCID